MTVVVQLFGDDMVNVDGAPVPKVLDAAKDQCEEVLVLGYTKGEGLIYAASSFPEPQGAERALWLIEKAKAWILDGCPEQEA